MSKKKKIIISAVCVSVLLIGLIVGIILANIKRFNIQHQDEFEFNNHTQIIEINRDDKYISVEKLYNGNPQTYFNGGTQIVKDESNHGIFSYFENNSFLVIFIQLFKKNLHIILCSKIKIRRGIH